MATSSTPSCSRSLQDASSSDTGGTTLVGDTLDTLARKYVAAQAVIGASPNWMDGEALHVLAGGLAIDLDSLDAAQASADKLRACSTTPRSPSRPTPHRQALPQIARMHHGNVRASVIHADFVHGADYEVLADAGQSFQGLIRRRPRPQGRRREG